MELYQFKLLETAEQIETIALQGVFLSQRTEDKFLFKLYKIDSFYIEEKWHNVFNELREILSFITSEGLSRYAESIDS